MKNKSEKGFRWAGGWGLKTREFSAHLRSRVRWAGCWRSRGCGTSFTLLFFNLTKQKTNYNISLKVWHTETQTYIGILTRESMQDFLTLGHFLHVTFNFNQLYAFQQQKANNHSLLFYLDILPNLHPLVNNIFALPNFLVLLYHIIFWVRRQKMNVENVENGERMTYDVFIFCFIKRQSKG